MKNRLTLLEYNWRRGMHLFAKANREKTAALKMFKLDFRNEQLATLLASIGNARASRPRLRPSDHPAAHVGVPPAPRRNAASRLWKHVKFFTRLQHTRTSRTISLNMGLAPRRRPYEAACDPRAASVRVYYSLRGRVPLLSAGNGVRATTHTASETACGSGRAAGGAGRVRRSPRVRKSSRRSVHVAHRCGARSTASAEAVVVVRRAAEDGSRRHVRGADRG